MAHPACDRRQLVVSSRCRAVEEIDDQWRTSPVPQLEQPHSILRHRQLRIEKVARQVSWSRNLRPHVPPCLRHDVGAAGEHHHGDQDRDQQAQAQLEADPTGFATGPRLVRRQCAGDDRSSAKRQIHAAIVQQKRMAAQMRPE